MKWWKEKVFPPLTIAFIIGCIGFFMDFQGLKAQVSNLELKFSFIMSSLKKIEKDVEYVKKGVRKLNP